MAPRDDGEKLGHALKEALSGAAPRGFFADVFSKFEDCDLRPSFHRFLNDAGLENESNGDLRLL